jgi:pimeloyl-ACP methyl ester carboxylesterase
LPEVIAFMTWTCLAHGAEPEVKQSAAARDQHLEPCQLPDVSRPARCGVLELPENPERPDGRQLAIHVAVVPAQSGSSLDDPIVVLMGGPGQTAIGAAADFIERLGPLLLDRDLLLVDQRGTGRSAPLQCNLYSPDEAAVNLRDFFPLTAVRRCAREVGTRSDLAQYSFAHSARDLEHVRRALGYGKLNLNSGSYGTRAAQVYLRMFPESVRTVYFASVVPTDVAIPLPLAGAAQQAMEKTFDSCEADAVCHAAFPKLPTEFRDILDRLDAGVNVAVAELGDRIPLSRGRVAEFLRARLYRAEGAATVPWLIHQAHAGNWTPIVDGILAGARQRDLDFSLGLFFAIACNEDTAFIDEADVAASIQGTFIGDYRVRQQQAACNEWPESELAPDYREPVHSTVPALFSSGDSDPATPLWFTGRVAASFPNRIEILMRNQGHTEWNECLAQLHERFVRTGTVEGLEAADCLPMPRPPFKTRPAPPE